MNTVCVFELWELHKRNPEDRDICRLLVKEATSQLVSIELLREIDRLKKQLQCANRGHNYQMSMDGGTLVCSCGAWK